jgi:hypothetical protein
MLEAKTFSKKHYDGSLHAAAEADGVVQPVEWRYGMVWYGMVWYGMVWYGTIWYDMVFYSINCNQEAYRIDQMPSAGKHEVKMPSTRAIQS